MTTNQSIINTIIFAAIFLFLFASAEIFYHIFKLKAELTRKYVHFVTGIVTLLFPRFIDNLWMVMILCSSFLIILLASLKYQLLPSINAVDRVTRGSILFPVIIYWCYFVYSLYNLQLFYYLPVIILAISDPLAGMIGQRYPFKKYKLFGHYKTLAGSISFMISSFLICFISFSVSFNLAMNAIIFLSFLIAISATLTEAMTHKGYDNLTVPLMTQFILILAKEFFLIF
jgi:phytol kinase